MSGQGSSSCTGISWIFKDMSAGVNVSIASNVSVDIGIFSKHSLSREHEDREMKDENASIGQIFVVESSRWVDGGEQPILSDFKHGVVKMSKKSASAFRLPVSSPHVTEEREMDWR